MSEDISSPLGGVTQTIKGDGNIVVAGNNITIQCDRDLIMKLLSLLEAKDRQIEKLQELLLKYQLEEIETTK